MAPSTSTVRLIERWFRRSQRSLPWRTSYHPYQVWISEVMLQQTRMEVVLPFFGRFITAFPTIAALAAARPEQVLAAWSGLGYYRRAKFLHHAAREIMTRFGGTLPRGVSELMTLPGIGRYTAGAIASIAYQEKAPIVDGNVARVLARLHGVPLATASPELMREAWRLAEDLVHSSSSPRDLNQGVMEIGALICRPVRPNCTVCPLRQRCAAHASGNPSAFPLRLRRTETRRLSIPLLLVTDDRGRLLMRHEEGPLMSSMLHLPHGAPLLFSAAPLQTTCQQHLATFRHTITNRSIEFHLYRAEIDPATVREPRDAYSWVSPDDVTALPHPSYVAKALKLARIALRWGAS